MTSLDESQELNIWKFYNVIRTVDGQGISIRQSTEAESKLSAIYDLLYINPKPLGKRKSMLHPNQTSKNPDIGNQGVT